MVLRGPAAVLETPRLVVISETASLASALVDLLRAEGFGVFQVRNAEEASAFAWPPDSAPRLLIAASNTRTSESVARWRAGTLGGTELVVVGSRDPELRSSSHLHVVALPLIPDDFLTMLRRLLSGRERDGRARERRAGLPRPPTRTVRGERPSAARVQPLIEAYPSLEESPKPHRV